MRPTAEQRRIVKRMEFRAWLVGAAKQALFWTLLVVAVAIGTVAIRGELPSHHWRDLWFIPLLYLFNLLIFAKDKPKRSRRKRGDRL